MPWYRLQIDDRPHMNMDVDLRRSYAEGDYIELDGETFLVTMITEVEQVRYPILKARPLREDEKLSG